MTNLGTPLNNQLLASLKPETQQTLLPLFKEVTLDAGSIPGSPGSENRYAYFPTSCIISTVNREADGAMMATAMIGREGMVGINFILGDIGTPLNALTQQSGIAYQLLATDLITSFHSLPDFQKVLLGYTVTLIEQISLNALYNRHFHIDQLLCRWILLSLDRLNTDTLAITHESISHLLGVRREGVTEAISSLRLKGAIESRRGQIKVLDKSLLKAMMEQDPAGLETETVGSKKCRLYSTVLR